MLLLQIHLVIEFKQLKEFYGQFSTFFKNRQSVFERFQHQIGPAAPVVKLPDFKQRRHARPPSLDRSHAHALAGGMRTTPINRMPTTNSQ